MKYKELKTHSVAELQKMLVELKAQAHEFKAKISLGQQKHTHKLKEARKDIARIMTFLASSK